MKIICIGRNYSEHAKELNNPVPEEPVFFIKPDSAILRNNTPFYIPEFTNEVHFEIEIVLKINRPGKHIAEQFAHKYFDEITAGIDFTARDVQQELKHRGLPWEKAKGFDGAAPIGLFVPKSSLTDINALDFRLEVNGEIKQHGNTRDMLFGFDKIIAYITRFVTLKKGDLIYTGTPAGVGPVKAGDRLQGFIANQSMFNFQVK
ncbi:MAG: fumarylacetoacetate hydrolase family protein [Bacteroidia bacterium]|jgi:acylpyruvate hydrolase|nr:fumarylacetoacetate hydrolase family protein [Bacteroidia bacterium]MCC6767643.1 fumarylacetoacetate hydrolase family protein [Bacteroidia bacterium]